MYQSVGETATITLGGMAKSSAFCFACVCMGFCYFANNTLSALLTYLGNHVANLLYILKRKGDTDLDGYLPTCCIKITQRGLRLHVPTFEIQCTASPTPRVLSAKPIGAPVLKLRRWANGQQTKYHSLVDLPRLPSNVVKISKTT